MNELLRILLCIIIIIGHTEGGDGFFYPATATIAFMMLSGYSSEISLQSGKFKSFKSYIRSINPFISLVFVDSRFYSFDYDIVRGGGI